MTLDGRTSGKTKDCSNQKCSLFQKQILGYRDDSLETVKRNRDQYGIPLKILSYEELYGWTMDKVNLH